MSHNLSHEVVVQFLVQGFGTDEEFQRRLAIEKLLGGVLKADDNGECTGGEAGSGIMNAFFDVNDPIKAREPILQALCEANELDEGMVIAHQIYREEDEEIEEQAQEIWWPNDYAFRFNWFGPMWRGELDQAEFSRLSNGLRSLQGQWKVIRYDAPDGSDGSAWASDLRFLIAQDQMVVYQSIAVISAGRLRIDVSGEIDLRPIMGSNRGVVSVGRYEVRGEELHLCILPPGTPRPETIAPKEKHHPGRMILQQQSSEKSTS